MKRGDIVIAAGQGDYGKPRPHVVVQSDALGEDVPSVVLCPITSVIRNLSFRLLLPPVASLGLQLPSEVMIDKIQVVRRDRIARIVGRLDDRLIAELDLRLTFVLGLRG